MWHLSLSSGEKSGSVFLFHNFTHMCKFCPASIGKALIDLITWPSNIHQGEIDDCPVERVESISLQTEFRYLSNIDSEFILFSVPG